MLNWSKRRLGAVVLGAAVLAAPGCAVERLEPAGGAGTAAQPARRLPANCLPRGQLLELHRKNFGEEVLWRGDGRSGLSFELLARPGGLSWSFVATIPPTPGLPETSCLVAAGKGWQSALDHVFGPET